MVDSPLRTVRRAAAAFTGFTLAAVVIGVLWWALTPAPEPGDGHEIAAVLDPDARIESASLVHADSMHTGARLIEVRINGQLDLGKVSTNARAAGWSAEADGSRLLVDAGDASVTVSPSRLLVDPHRSLWPTVAVLGGGLLGGAAALALSWRRDQAGRPERIRAVVAAGWLPTIVIATAFVLLGLVIGPVGRPDPAAAAMTGALATAWFSVVLGLLFAGIVWKASSDD